MEPEKLAPSDFPPAAPKRPGVVFLLAIAHGFALLLLSVDYWNHWTAAWGRPPLEKLSSVNVHLWLGLVCSQISLAAMFAVFAPFPLLLRIPAGVIAAALGWALLLVALPGSGRIYSGAWAIMVALQASLVLAGASLLRLLVRQAEQGGIGKVFGQYGISTLLAWMTLVGVALGVLRWGIRAYGWDQSLLKWEWFWHVLLIGVFNAAFAIVVLASVMGSRWSRLRRVWGLVIAVILVAHQPFLFAALFRSLGADYADLWMIGGVQVAVLFATLLILRWAGGLTESPPLRYDKAAC